MNLKSCVEEILDDPKQPEKWNKLVELLKRCGEYRNFVIFLQLKILSNINNEIVLDIIDFCVDKGVYQIMGYINEEEFINVLYKIMRKDSGATPSTQKKVLYLVQKWGIKYMPTEKKPTPYQRVYNFYQYLIKNKIVFPPKDDNNIPTYKQYVDSNINKNVSNKSSSLPTTANTNNNISPPLLQNTDKEKDKGNAISENLKIFEKGLTSGTDKNNKQKSKVSFPSTSSNTSTVDTSRVEGPKIEENVSQPPKNSSTSNGCIESAENTYTKEIGICDEIRVKIKLVDAMIDSGSNGTYFKTGQLHQEVETLCSRYAEVKHYISFFREEPNLRQKFINLKVDIDFTIYRFNQVVNGQTPDPFIPYSETIDQEVEIVKKKPAINNCEKPKEVPDNENIQKNSEPKKETVQKSTEKFVEEFQKSKEKFKEGFQKNSEKIKESFQKNSEKIKDGFNKVKDSIKTSFVKFMSKEEEKPEKNFDSPRKVNTFCSSDTVANRIKALNSSVKMNK